MLNRAKTSLLQPSGCPEKLPSGAHEVTNEAHVVVHEVRVFIEEAWPAKMLQGAG